MSNVERAAAIREQQYQKLNQILGEALRAYERSCQLRLVKVRVTDRESRHGRARETVREEERGSGDPRFLDVALRAWVEIRSLFGIGLEGPDTAVGTSGTVYLTTQWGTWVALPAEPVINVAASATVTGDESAANPGDTVITGAKRDEHPSDPHR